MRGKRFASSRSGICTASRESVFCFRTIAADLGGIAHPKLVQLDQHPSKPLRVAGCFHAHAHWLLQSSVELLRLTVAMVESAFDEFPAFRIHHRNLLEARMSTNARSAQPPSGVYPARPVPY